MLRLTEYMTMAIEETEINVKKAVIEEIAMTTMVLAVVIVATEIGIAKPGAMPSSTS
jgi:hypothetical protein